VVCGLKKTPDPLAPRVLTGFAIQNIAMPLAVTRNVLARASRIGHAAKNVNSRASLR
jgi:hypothetical protein